MKIIHCSDIHLGASMRTHLSMEQAKRRQDELLATFLRMIEYAQNNDIRHIIIAGDLLDTDFVSVKNTKILLDTISHAPNIDFYYLCGNHDENSLLLQSDTIPDNLKTFASQWTTYSLPFSINITGAMLGKDNASLYENLKLDADKYNIVVLHGADITGNDVSTPDTVNLDKLKNKNIDYLALGHLHSYKTGKLDSRGTYVYSGCLEGRGFDECGEKGFVELDITDKKLSYTFVPFAYRQLHEIEIDITDKKNNFELQQEIKQKTENLSNNDLVRVIFTGYYDENSQKYFNLAIEPLMRKFYYVQVKDRTQVRLNLEKYENEISIAGEFIKSVRNSGLPQEEQDKIIILGLKTLKGEEVEF